MRFPKSFARTLALGLSAAVISVATATAANAAPANVAPKLIAGLRVSPTAPVVGKAVQVDVHGTKVPKRDSIRSITVSFGDHTKAVHLKTVKGSTRHAYAKAGTYTVTVTIVDTHGKRVVKTKRVVVHAPPTTSGPTPTAHAFPITVPATATPATLLGSVLSPEQITAVATQLATPANVLPYVPVGYLKLLPTSELSLPASGLPRMPGLVGLPTSGDLVSLLTNLVGLPIVLPTTGLNPFQPLGEMPVVSFAQLGSVSALLGMPSTLVAKLPAIALLLLPGNLLQLGSAPTAGLPVVIPSGLAPTDLISKLNLPTGVTNEVASLLSTPPSVLPSLPVSYLGLLSQIAPSAITGANLLPALPGFTGIDLNNLLTSLLAHGMSGFPLTLPQGLDLTQSLGSLPTTALTATQVSSLATLFGISPATVAQLPLLAVHLLPSTLWSFVTGTGGTGGVALPIAIPTGLSATTTIAQLATSLGLPGSIVDQLAAELNVPTSVLDQLPVGVLRALPSSAVTLPVDLPKLPLLASAGLLDPLTYLSSTLGLAGLPVAIPTGLDPGALVGSLPSSAVSGVQLGTLAQIFGGIPVGTLQALPVTMVTGLLPASLLATGNPIASYLTGLPITLPANLTPTTVVSALSLTGVQLSSISSLLNIPTGTVSTLPVGFLRLLPAADLTGGTVPALPGLGSLPLLGNALGMLLAGLPITVPVGTAPSTLISALPGGVLSLVQLTTLSTFFGISPTTLATLPVGVLSLLPTGYVTGP